MSALRAPKPTGCWCSDTPTSRGCMSTAACCSSTAARSASPRTATRAALVTGSGIAAQQLSPGNTGLQLLENAAATAAGLFTIILMFGPVSGGHFNPVVSLVDASFGGLRWRDALAYVPGQIAGCIAG